jgi:predicted dehydrogenase
MRNGDGRLGIAVVGCGYWGKNHVRVFSELPEARLVAVCDQAPDRLQEIGKRYPGLHLSSQLDEVLALEDVDAVVVCTEPASHFSIARACLVAGKHALVEKPLTTSLARAEELSIVAETHSVTLMVGHTFIYNAGVRKVKEYIDQSDHVYYMYARRTNLGPIRRDVNALWDLATHDIAIFNYLLDEVPTWVNAVGAKVLRNCREDVGFVILGYRNGVVGHIHVSWADPNKARETVVVCSDKRIVFNDLNPLEQVRVFEKGVQLMESSEPSNFGEYRLHLRDGDILSPKIEASEPLKEQCRHFLHCVKTGERPITDGWAGGDVLRVLEAIDRSIQNGGTQTEVAQNVQYARQSVA